MANGYRYFFTENGSINIPVSDGDHFIRSMSIAYSTGVCSIRFLDSNLDPVTPTGGTITFASAVIGEQYHTPSNGSGVINAVDVSEYSSSYTLPRFNAGVIATRLTLDGVTGAEYFQASHWRGE